MATLEPQIVSQQNRYKLCFNLPLQNDSKTLYDNSWRIGLANLAASLIFSIDDSRTTGLLDIIPTSASKWHALEILMTHLSFDITNTVFAGIVATIFPALVSSVPSILVANADFETIKQVTSQSRQPNTMAALYLAQDGFLGMNGYSCSGILEGLVHFQPHTQTWMIQDYGSK